MTPCRQPNHLTATKAAKKMRRVLATDGAPMVTDNSSLFNHRICICISSVFICAPSVANRSGLFLLPLAASQWFLSVWHGWPNRLFATVIRFLMWLASRLLQRSSPTIRCVPFKRFASAAPLTNSPFVHNPLIVLPVTAIPMFVPAATEAALMETSGLAAASAAVRCRRKRRRRKSRGRNVGMSRHL